MSIGMTDIQNSEDCNSTKFRLSSGCYTPDIPWWLMTIGGLQKEYWGESHFFVGNPINQPGQRDDRGFWTLHNCKSIGRGLFQLHGWSIDPSNSRNIHQDHQNQLVSAFPREKANVDIPRLKSDAESMKLLRFPRGSPKTYLAVENALSSSRLESEFSEFVLLSAWAFCRDFFTNSWIQMDEIPQDFRHLISSIAQICRKDAFITFGEICSSAYIYFISWQLETLKVDTGFDGKVIYKLYKPSISKGFSMATFDYQRLGGYFSH